MKKIEAIQKFLKFQTSPLTKLYNPNMEIQVNVAKDSGKRIKGTFQGKTWRGFQDPVTNEIWKSFRIPWNSNGNAEYIDTELKFDLASHVEGIGMTGWDWVNKQSLWVGYDFDSVTNHKEGMTNEELEELKIKTGEVEWVTLFRSTSGKGIHLYLFFDKPFSTQNHSEHAALARSLLSILTVEIGFNFFASVDTCGNILWCYHRKQEGTNGLTCIKEGNKFSIKNIPSNWKDHIGVINRTKKKTHSGNRDIENLSSSIKNLLIDNEHQNILKWFNHNSKMDWWWDTDYNMLVCHTYDLRDCYKELNLRGLFETNSSGSSTQNCFAFPIRNGSFIVRRYGKRVSEAKTWIIDEHGWTKCFFNSNPTLHEACIFNNGMENTRGEFVFENSDSTRKALLLLGLEYNFPPFFTNRPIVVKSKGDKIILKIEIYKTDPESIDGFLREKKYWVIVFLHKKEIYEEIAQQDNLVRHVISNKVEAGWYINVNNEWVLHTKSNVVSVLVSQMQGYSRQEIEQTLGKTLLDPWILVNRPFEDEYLGNRNWNKDAAQLSIKPVQGKIEYWWNLLEHLGSGLDEAVKNNKWCLDNNITDGSDYLFAWVSFLIQKPAEQLPYLFLFGEQKTGKSTLHEGLSLLFKNKIGYTRADQALKSTSGFNAELAHAVLCVVEETNLSKNNLALNRIKDWVTGKTISIRALYQNAYEMENTTHWIQCANDGKNCPIFPGDTRIVAIEVPMLEKEIPKYTFLNLLGEEISALLYEILHYELPEPEGRLNLPCLDTDLKKEIMQDNFSALEQFMEEKTKIAMGHLTCFNEFYTCFQMWLSSNALTESNYWSIRKTSMKFPKTGVLVKGIYGSDNKVCIGNLSFDLAAEDLDFKYGLDNKRLIKTKKEEERDE
jgi:hypothetical protein